MAVAIMWINVITTERLCKIINRCLFSESAAALIAGIRIWRVGIVVSAMMTNMMVPNVLTRTDNAAAMIEVIITKV